MENYHATIETTYEKSIALKRNEFECDIIDTAGQVRSLSYPLFPIGFSQSSHLPPFGLVNKECVC